MCKSVPFIAPQMLCQGYFICLFVYLNYVLQVVDGNLLGEERERVQHVEVLKYFSVNTHTDLMHGDEMSGMGAGRFQGRGRSVALATRTAY